MKKLIHIFAAALLALGLCGSAASAQQAPPVLTSFDFTIVGVGLGVSPACQAVPRDANLQ